MAIRITGMNSGLDTDAMVKDLVAAYEKKGQKTKNEQTKLNWKQDIWKDLNKKIKSFSSKVANMKFSSAYSMKKTVSSDETKASVVASDNAVVGTQTLEVKKLAKTAYMTSGKLGAGTSLDGKVTENTKLSDLGFNGDKASISIKKANGDNVTFDVKGDTTVAEFKKMAEKSGLNVNFDKSSGRLFMYSNKSGSSEDFSIESSNDDALKALGLYEYSDEEKKAMTDKTLANVMSATMIHGEDAEISLNGATFTSSTNTFAINGMSITAKDVTSGPLSITTDRDYDAIYDSIKGVIKEYSELINELDKLYNADTAKKFEPLTDEEKEALSESEIEKWETKIKDSLLRRDENVNSVASALKNAGLNAYKIGGKNYSLSDFGIGTLSFFLSEDNQKNALHIDGDEDDSDVSGNTNKLKSMLASNTDDTIKFFTKYFESMSDNLTKISRSNTSRSYGNFYDDKIMGSDITKYEKKVSDFESYIADIEEKYYKQFTRMEKELAKLNSTQSQMASYFGMG